MVSVPVVSLAAPSCTLTEAKATTVIAAVHDGAASAGRARQAADTANAIIKMPRMAIARPSASAHRHKRPRALAFPRIPPAGLQTVNRALRAGVSRVCLSTPAELETPPGPPPIGDGPRGGGVSIGYSGGHRVVEGRGRRGGLRRDAAVNGNALAGAVAGAQHAGAGAAGARGR